MIGMLTVVQEARQAGDGLLVLTSVTSVHGSQRSPCGHAARQLGSARHAGERRRLSSRSGPASRSSRSPRSTGSQVIAAMPVYSQASAGQWIGTVLLARSTQSLDHEILELWVILGSIAAAAMIAAALLGFGLARWVSRPLKGLDAAARRLADGDLAIRATVASGPPELRRLGTTFNTMAGRLEALVHGNRAVIADVSHQLRTPLAALRLRLDLLAADTDSGHRPHELAGALDELARLSRLVDGLLTVARAENVVPVPVGGGRAPRWPGSGWWPGIRWPTTAASSWPPPRRAPAACTGRAGPRARRRWPGSARGTWSRSWTT